MKKLQILIVSLVFVLPLAASAIGVGFGGLITFVIPCTCSPTLGYAVNYTPLYISSPVPTVGALYYSEVLSFLYSWYNPITPGVWNLGKFIPSTGECWTGEPPACVLYPTEGHIEFEGTSALL